jgi:hypothetical protein
MKFKPLLNPLFLPLYILAFALLVGLSLTLVRSISTNDQIPSDFTVKMERRACFGACPVYTVKVYGNGNVEYSGVKFVRVTGQQNKQISTAEAARLYKAAEEIKIFDLQDEYTANITDLPSTNLTITYNNRTKKIHDYYGAPAELTEFEKLVDEVADTDEWINTYNPTRNMPITDINPYDDQLPEVSDPFGF